MAYVSNSSVVVLPIEYEFDYPPAQSWMKRNWIHSVTLSLIYLIFIYTAQKVMATRKAMSLEKPLLYWNAFLALFSILGFVRVTPEFMDALFSKGYQYSICNIRYGYGVSGFWALAFTLSKALELVDTGFVVLRKRPLLFLHVYHHISVMLYCWFTYTDIQGAGRWFTWMNFTVHSIMYTYYACRTWGVRFPKWIPMMITSLQLAQMVAGSIITVSLYSILKNHQPCSQSWENLYATFAMYLSYFALFVKFFYDTYIRKGSRYSIIADKTKKVD